MTYDEIKPRKIADAILERLEQMLVEGSLAPGQRLPAERELAKQFAVSRPSLREAMQKLEARGLVTRRQGGGTYVGDGWQRDLSDPLMDLLAHHDEAQYDLLEFRHALEGISAYYAALRGTANDFANIQNSHAAIAKAQVQQDVCEEARAVSRFYLAIAEASHNVVLLHLVRGLEQMLRNNIEQNLRQLATRPKVGDQVNAHRDRLLAAIVEGRPEAAREACHEHLAFIEETLMAMNREQSRIQRSLRRMQGGPTSGPTDED